VPYKVPIISFGSVSQGQQQQQQHSHQHEQELGRSTSPAEAVAAVAAVVASVKASYCEDRLLKEQTPTGVTLRFGQPPSAEAASRHASPTRKRGVSVLRPNSPAARRRNDPDRPIVAVHVTERNRGLSPGGRRLDRRIIEVMQTNGVVATVSAPRPIGTLDKLGGAWLSSRRASEGPVRAHSRSVSFSGESARERDQRLQIAVRVAYLHSISFFSFRWVSHIF
jgi:hypothetical protein